MWSKPWSYKEGLVIGAGLLVIGILLQMAVGASRSEEHTSELQSQR